jgi:hypothetical protein
MNTRARSPHLFGDTARARILAEADKLREQAMSGHPPRRASTIPEFCDRYRISRSSFYKLVAAGQLRISKLSSRSIILPEHEDEFRHNLSSVHGRK